MAIDAIGGAGSTNLQASSLGMEDFLKILLDTAPVSLQELEQQLNAVKAQTPEFPVVVRGDGLTQYQGVMDVLDVLGRLGLSQVGLATKPAK